MAIRRGSVCAPCLWIILYTVISSADTAAIEITCPAHLIDGEDNDVICKINANNVTSGCIIEPTTVGFFFTPAGGGRPTSLCLTEYKTSTCSDHPQTNKCGCTERNANTATFSFRFFGNRTRYSGAVLFCSVCPDLSLQSHHCDGITFDTPTTTVTTAMVTETGRGARLQIHLYEMIIPIAVAVAFQTVLLV